MEEGNYKFSDEEKTLNIHNEVENDIFTKDPNGFSSNESIQEHKPSDIHEVENNIFIENPNGFTSHQTIQYSSTNLLGE